MKVWVLTYAVKGKAQHGEYFVAVFKDLPPIEVLVDYLDPGPIKDIAELLKFTIHVQKGGGRRDQEDQWYYLKQVELK